MKTIAINFSQNDINDTTSNLLKSFIDGLKETGSSTEILNVCRFDIKPCKECTKDLLFESPGFCEQIDDMQTIYPKLKSSDIWVFALSIDFKESLIKLNNVLDRLEPLFEPFPLNGYTNGNGHTNKKSSHGKIVLIATSEDWELNHFNNVIDNISGICSIYNKDFVATILRPHSWVLTAPDKINININDLFNSCKSAGIELGSNGFITEQTLIEIRKPLIPKDSFSKELTQIFQKI